MSRDVTKIVQRFNAGTVDVCRVGSTVALHFNTTDGVVLIHMREREFIKCLRGPVDHNGHPFRTTVQLDAEKNLLVGALNNTNPTPV